MGQRKRSITAGVAVLFLGCVGLVAYLTYDFFVWLPTESRIRGCLTTTMYQVELCPGGKDYVKLASVSPYLQKALVASEDGRFWTHQGFDFEEIKTSIETNLEKRTFRRGGSTITQQLAKNMFLTREKTMTRKFYEALITFQLERVLSKKEILEHYLNVVQFGDGVFGVKKAASLYFGKSPSSLTLLESTFLVMLLPNPGKYARSYHQKKLTPYARKRMTQIVQRMREGDRISAGEADQAIAQLGFFFLDESKLREAEELSRRRDDGAAAEADELIGTDEVVDEQRKKLEAAPTGEPADGDSGDGDEL